MSEQIPIDAQAGEFIEEYRCEGPLQDFLVGSFLLVLGLASLVGGLFIAIFFSATIFFFLAGGTLLYLAYQTRGLRLLVCSNALIRVQRGKTDVLPWNEILEVRRAVAWELAGNLPIVGVAPPLVIVLLDGRKWAFYRTLPYFLDFVEDVERKSLPPLLDAAMQRLASGKRLKFGTVMVSEKGIHVRDNTLRWKYFTGITWQEENLLIWEEDEDRPFVRRNISLLPNCHLLLALCSRYGASQA